MSERRGDWIQTYTGRQFWPLDPRPADVTIEDVAHALSNLCRYTGHCKTFYSVAQHSVLVSENVAPELALWGLLHDASEAYLHDLPRPLKRLPEFAFYRELEKMVMAAVCVRFGLPIGEPAEVKAADQRLLFTELRDIKSQPPRAWDDQVEPFPWKIQRTWGPIEAEGRFLSRFVELGGLERLSTVCADCGASHKPDCGS